MKTLQLSIFLLSLFTAHLVTADAASEKEAEILLNSMGMEEAMVQSMSQMIDLQIQQNPTLGPYKSVMMEFFDIHMSWESLKPEFLRIYAEAFSAGELQEINRFYATDTGKKTIKLMPFLMAEGSQVGISRVQDNIGELQVMIKAESERLQQLSKE